MAPASESQNPAAFLKAAREITATWGSGERFRLAILSTFTAEFLRPYLTVESARRGCLIEPAFAPWGQLEEQVLDPSSDLYQRELDGVLLLVRLEELCPQSIHQIAMDPAAQMQLLEEFSGRLGALVREVRTRVSGPIFIGNFVPPRFAPAGLADPQLGSLSQDGFVAAANAKLSELVSVPDSRVFVLDLNRRAAEIGLTHWFDDRQTFLTRMPWSVSAQIAVADRLARMVVALRRPARKVLVLDLDNTLWGGVLGEDGVGAIQLGDEYPGNVFKAFHRYLLALKQRGVLLAIASRNNPSDVEEVWKVHGDSLLKQTDFVALRIGWGDKSCAIRQIAEELNLGLNAVAFFDDHPAERAEVSRMLPEVLVIESPESPVDYVSAIENSGAFDLLSITSEDRHRTALYAQRESVKLLEQTAICREDFLRSLEMRVTTGLVDPTTLPRVTQLLGKTNQFNVTTRRHDAAAVESLVNAGAIAMWLRVADKFGDSGLVGVAIAVPTPEEATWSIDSLLLSCRVLGRGVETALLVEILERIHGAGGRTAIGEFFASPRNAQTAEFYPDHGFTRTTVPNHFALDLTTSKVSSPAHIAVERV